MPARGPWPRKRAEIPLDRIIPGGILESDTPTVSAGEAEKCSRCRRLIREDEVPLRLWTRAGTYSWAFCDDCTGRGPAEVSPRG